MISEWSKTCFKVVFAFSSDWVSLDEFTNFRYEIFPSIFALYKGKNEKVSKWSKNWFNRQNIFQLDICKVGSQGFSKIMLDFLS